MNTSLLAGIAGIVKALSAATLVPMIEAGWQTSFTGLFNQRFNVKVAQTVDTNGNPVNNTSAPILEKQDSAQFLTSLLLQGVDAEIEGSSSNEYRVYVPDAANPESSDLVTFTVSINRL